jgi:hypothetical protein
MKINKLTILLTESEMSELRQSAALDCRRVEDQARFLIRSVLFAKQLEEYRLRDISTPLISPGEAKLLIKKLEDISSTQEN